MTVLTEDYASVIFKIKMHNMFSKVILHFKAGDMYFKGRFKKLTMYVRQDRFKQYLSGVTKGIYSQHFSFIGLKGRMQRKNQLHVESSRNLSDIFCIKVIYYTAK